MSAASWPTPEAPGALKYADLEIGELYTSIDINMAECPKGTLLFDPLDGGEYLLRSDRFWISTDCPVEKIRLLLSSYFVVYLPVAAQPAAAASEKDTK